MVEHAEPGVPGKPCGEIGCLGRCGLARKTRGLCSACYLRALIRVNLGETTWAELEALGQSLPARSKRSISDQLRRRPRR